ncbi:MAG: type 1 glutamine amidotransferase [Planctomycetes bacterium]|nr:type 1 glutamine amidotransferase [Planctomycetota bacterium]
MKIAVLVEDNYQVLEVWYPYYRLKEEGMQTIFVGTGRQEEYKSKEGYPVKEELAMKNARPEEFTGVIIPGGYAPDILRRHKEINDFVKKMSDQGKLIATICHGGWVAVSAGILKGRKATCFSAIKDDIINAGAKYVDSEVIVDGNLVTSRMPSDLPAFCREIIRVLKHL